MSILRLSPLIVALAIGLCGCSGDSDGEALVPMAPDGRNQPPNSVSRMEAPRGRSQAYTDSLNQYRRETFGDTSSSVRHSDVLYTAAYRHAVYLNTANSEEYYGPNLAAGEEGDVIMPDDKYVDLLTEETISNTGGGSSAGGGTSGAGPTPIFPAMRTHATLWGRIAAVRGGPDLLKSLTVGEVTEGYAVTGNVDVLGTSAGGSAGDVLPTFRGFDASTGLSPIDSLWYSRVGRLYLMRADLKFVGFASPNDGNVFTPWPIFNGQFSGVLTQVGSRPAVNRLGFWPNDGNTNVMPYGLDTTEDLGGQGENMTEDEDGGQLHQYSGPPIHVTLPVTEPILLSSVGGIRSTVFYFSKCRVDPETGEEQSPPPAGQMKRYKIFLGGAKMDVIYTDNGREVAADYPANAPYIFDPSSSDSSDESPYFMRGNEIFIVPNQPLEPNSWYEVGVRLATVSYALEDPSDEYRVFRWKFKTNGMAIPAY